jgi:hypothetical protein
MTVSQEKVWCLFESVFIGKVCWSGSEGLYGRLAGGDAVLYEFGTDTRLGECPSHGILCQTFCVTAFGRKKAKEKRDEC